MVTISVSSRMDKRDRERRIQWKDHLTVPVGNLKVQIVNDVSVSYSCLLGDVLIGAGLHKMFLLSISISGINRRSLSRLFEIQEERALAGWIYENFVSILEVYNENVYVSGGGRG